MVGISGGSFGGSEAGWFQVCCLHACPPAVDLLACGACWEMEMRPGNSMISVWDLAWTLDDPYTPIIGR